MMKQEMISNASIPDLGGSETAATLLSGTIYLLCTYSEVSRSSMTKSVVFSITSKSLT